MSTTNSNLDLSEVPSEDFDKLAEKIESFYRSDSNVKSVLSYNWERNHLMLDGKQWLVYDGTRDTGGIWRELKVSRANEYIPRPVTNYLFDAYQTLKAYLTQHRPRSTVRPNKYDYKNKQAAKLAELILECNWEKLKEENNYEYMAACVLVYGTAFKKDYWDTSTVSMVKIPRMVTVPKTDPATGQVIGQEEVPATDPVTGDAIVDEMPLGDVNTCVIEPFRIALDPLATDLHTTRWIMEYSIQPLGWIRETYGVQKPGYTGLADEVTEEKNLSNSMQRFFTLKTSSGVKFPGQATPGGSSSSSDEMVENAAIVKEYYERPSQQYPHGRMIVVANKKVLYSGDSPYMGPELGDWHPYSECRWEIVPGRFWGKSPFDDASEIQKQINSIDATIILTRKTTAIPQKLIPINSGVKPGEWTGRPGQEIRYRPSEGAKPETVPGVGVDPSVFTERQMRVEDLKNITGAIDILKGDRPPGVTAASALEMLFEVGTGKLRPALNRWSGGTECSQKKQLKIICNKYKEPRKDFIRLLASKNKDIPEEVINDFLGTDLYDNCNVIIEAGSNVPKLASAEKAQLLQVAQTGALQLENPENRIEFLDRLGIVGFDTDVGPDVKRAEWENDLMDNIKNSPDNKPVVLQDEEHEVHLEIHNRRMKEPAFMSLSIEVQQMYMMHIQEHHMIIEQKQQMEVMQAAITGVPPQPEQSKGAPQPLPASGKGIPADTSDKLAQVDMPKAQA